MFLRGLYKTMTVAIISRTDLARNTREIVEQVRRGQTVLLQSYGEDQIVLLDVLDYRLLKALGAYGLREMGEVEPDSIGDVVRSYLSQEISLSKAAEMLNTSRYDLLERFERLGVPLRFGAQTVDEARVEVDAAQDAGTHRA